MPGNDVSKRMRHRLEAISHMRSTVGAGGDNTPILSEELRQLPETMRTNTLQVAGITYNEVPEEFLLNLKLSLGLTWKTRSQWKTLQMQRYFYIIVVHNFNGYEL